MIVAVNDISFLWGFESKYEAKQALIHFGNVALGLKDEKVSAVKAEIDIVNSDRVNKALCIAPEYTLINALYEIKESNMEQFLFILQILTQCGEIEDTEEEFIIGQYSSPHCARYRDSFLISIVSHDMFSKNVLQGLLTNKKYCEIRNISDENDKYTYWKELGFREYELNKKHGNWEYIRAGGYKVGIAPETDELGQKLLNHAVVVGNRLFAVDHEKDNRIFEFRHSYANKFHAFHQAQLPQDLVRKILKNDGSQSI